MKLKTKKIISLSLAIIIGVTITLYYLWPFIFINYFTGIKSSPYLYTKPEYRVIEKNNYPSQELHNLGIITADITTPRITNMIAGEHSLRIEYKTYYLTILPWENVDNREEMQFGKFCEIYNTTPDDIRLFNKKGANLKIMMNIILKSIATTSDTIDIINTDDINIISQIYINENGTKKRMISIYDIENKYTQSFMISSKTNDENLEQQYNIFINSVTYSEVKGRFIDHISLLIKEIEPTKP